MDNSNTAAETEVTLSQVNVPNSFAECDVPILIVYAAGTRSIIAEIVRGSHENCEQIFVSFLVQVSRLSAICIHCSNKL